MGTDTNEKKPIFKDIKGVWPILTLIIFCIACYIFACLQSLEFVSPTSAAFQLDTITAIELLIASVGFTYVLYRRSCRKRGEKTDLKRPVKYLLVFCAFFAIAFSLEVTVLQYHHYSGLENNEIVSSEENPDSWRSLNMMQYSVRTEMMNVDYYFSTVDLFSGKLEEDNEKVEELNSHNFQNATNAMDDELAAILAEKEEIIAEEGIEAAYPLPVTYDEDLAVAKFENLDTRVSSIYIEPFFLQENNLLNGEEIDRIDVKVLYSDEDNTFRETEIFTVVEGLEYTNYIPLHTVGKASQVSVCFIGEGAAFTQIVLNKTIPLSPSVGRMALISLLIFVVYFLKNNNVLAIAYDEKSKRQNITSLVLVAVLFTYFIGVACNTVEFSYEEYSAGQYNHYLVDALIDGRVYLDIPTSEEYLSLERKYDRSSWQLYGIENPDEELHWDTAYYNGRWYCYFGVVPAILLFVPYTLMTGNYLPYSAACCLFGCLAAVFLLLIWRRFFTKYLSGKPYVVYVLSSACVSLCSFIPFLLRRSFFYETVNLGGLMFCSAGFLLLLRYYDNAAKRKWLTLTASCLCFALAVGCRPIMVFSSVFVPLFLWKDVRELLKNDKRSFVKLSACVAIPYIAVAIPLMWYNYARFGSPFDFGLAYQVTGLNIEAQSLLSPVGYIQRFLTGIAAYLFNPPGVSLIFPFVSVQPVIATYSTHIPQYLGAVGIFSIPVMWLLVGALGGKKYRKSAPMTVKFIVVSLVLTVITAGLSVKYCLQPRYEIDYAWLMVLSALSCIYFIYARCGNDGKLKKAADVGITAILALSVVFFVFLCFRGEIFDDISGNSLIVFYRMKRAFTWFEGT